MLDWYFCFFAGLVSGLRRFRSCLTPWRHRLQCTWILMESVEEVPLPAAGARGWRDALRRRLPVLRWAPRYERTTAVADAVAGVTLGLTMVPQSIAYASLANLPVQYGLYSAFVGETSGRCGLRALSRSTTYLITEHNMLGSGILKLRVI